MDYERIAASHKRLVESIPTTEELTRGLAGAAKRIAEQMPTMEQLAANLAAASKSLRDFNDAFHKFGRQK